MIQINRKVVEVTASASQVCSGAATAAGASRQPCAFGYDRALIQINATLFRRFMVVLAESETAPASSGERYVDHPLGKLAYMITKVHEFDVEVPPVDNQSGSNPSDDSEWDVLQNSADNPAY